MSHIDTRSIRSPADVARLGKELCSVFLLLATQAVTTGDGHSASEYEVAMLIEPCDGNDWSGLALVDGGDFRIVTQHGPERSLAVACYASAEEVFERFPRDEIALGAWALLQNALVAKQADLDKLGQHLDRRRSA